MENWEKVIRRSDAKVRDLPAKPENWERLAADLAQLPPVDPPPPASGSAFSWWWWTGGAVTVVAFTLAGYALFTEPSTAKRSASPPISAAIASAPTEDTSGLRTTTPDSDDAAERAITSAPAAKVVRSKRENPLPAPRAALPATGKAISDRSAATPSLAARRAAGSDSERAASGAATEAYRTPGLTDSVGSRLGAVRDTGQRVKTAEPSTGNKANAVAPLAATPLPAIAIPARDLATLAAPSRPDEQRWRAWLGWGIRGYKIDPWVPFYRLEEEIPNQESIVPAQGPEELFLVGEFLAFEAEEINQDYRLLLEHRIGKQLWAYGGVRHQRLVYRLDDERTNYTGTDADLLFRGRIRYRETGMEAGLNYRLKPFRWGLAQLENWLEIRAGVYYATQRARIFDGSLQARALSTPLPFRYREEILPRNRWGYQAELVSRMDLFGWTNLYLSTGLFGGSDGVLRFVPLQIGITHQF